MESAQQQDPLEPIEDIEITLEEREHVLRQIDAAIERNRTPAGADPALMPAEKRGLFFPLIINLTALLLVAAGVLLLFRYFELRKESITLRRDSYLSAEATVIQTLKQQSETRLAAKDREIISIQEELRQVDRERLSLQQNLEAEVSAKERELNRQMAEQLSRERERLLSLGTSEAGIIDRLRVLENRQIDSIDRQIEQHRRELDRRLQDKQRELLDSERRGQEALEQAKRERELLEAELGKQQSEKIAAEQRLEELTVRVREEELLSQRASAAERADERADERAAKLEAELEASRKEVEDLQGRMQASVDASSSDKSRNAVLARQLQQRVDSLNVRMQRQSAQLATAEGEIKRLRADARELQAERDTLSVSLQTARTARAQSLEQGRDEALREVLTFLNFLSGSGESGAEVESELLALARRDPLFRAATREIQVLIAGGGERGELASPFVFLGIVSTVSADRVVIEAMVGLDVKVGSVIQIRRISELDREITIAEGTVQQVRGSKITATFKLTASAVQGPGARDPVYLAAQGS